MNDRCLTAYLKDSCDVPFSLQDVSLLLRKIDQAFESFLIDNFST